MKSSREGQKVYKSVNFVHDLATLEKIGTQSVHVSAPSLVISGDQICFVLSFSICAT